jgi:catechol 2,3-dioxygenase-like lactoylglutathione lyase family enzyme
LNVADRERSARFYEQHLHAERVRLNDTTDALRATPTLLLMDQRASPPQSGLPTALQHMGWGSADVAAWYQTAHAEGVAPDTRGNTLFATKDTPTLGEPGSGAAIALLGNVPACFPVPDAASYIYVLGPDQERIEIWSGVDKRVNHLHFTTPDLAATASWYQRFLGVTTTAPLFSFTFFLDDILFFFEPIGQADAYKPTDDHVLSHFALSVTDLDAWHKRATDQSIEIVAQPAMVHGFKSFFVRGPDGVLIELVQATPAKELCPSASK